MPRYYFHVKDGDDYIDRQGTELMDLQTARREAVRFAGALLADQCEQFWEQGDWNMRVADGDGITLFQLTFFATKPPRSADGWKTVSLLPRPERAVTPPF